MVERRKGGESGVKSVQYLAGQAVWEARDAGLWSAELAEAAVAACLAGGKATVPAGSTGIEDCPEPAVFLIEYTEGFKAGAANDTHSVCTTLHVLNVQIVQCGIDLLVLVLALVLLSSSRRRRFCWSYRCSHVDAGWLLKCICVRGESGG